MRVAHQNMLRFGGGAAHRNAAFNAAFTAIGGATGAVYWALGFTEIVNASQALRDAIGDCATSLDAGLTSVVVIETGTTALGMTEYIGIVWDNAAIAVEHVGHVVHDSDSGHWEITDTAVAAIPANRTITAQRNVSLDTRGLAYVAGRSVSSGNRYILGFMHNMYGLGDRSGPFTSLKGMAASVQGIAATYANAEVIIGGDFNILPRNPATARAPGVQLYARAARVGGPASAYEDTTLWHPYDFWVVSRQAITDADALVHDETRDIAGGCSDHAAITLYR